MTVDKNKKPIETKDAEWTYDGGKPFPIADDWIKKHLLNPKSPFNIIDNIKNGNIKFIDKKNGKEVKIPLRWLKFGKYQGTAGFTQPAKPELDARKLKVCDGNCEDCW